MKRTSLRTAALLVSALLVLAVGYWLGRPDTDNPVGSSHADTGSAPKTSTPAKSAPALPPLQAAAGGSKLSPQELEWTANARPTERTSLLLLDLSKIPTEKDLRMAGQLGEELIPTRAANPADIKDAAARAKQEQENMDFGKAIQKWNLHEYDRAYAMFLDHLTQFPDSAWAAESELHLGCHCQYKGKFDESQKFFEASQSRSPTGHSMNAKATLRLGALSMEQGKYKEATEHFTSLKAASDTPSHGTYAAYWILRLSLMKQKQTAMRDCAQKSLSEVCAVLGKPEEAKKLRALENKNPDGLNLQEIEDLAAKHDLTAQTVFTTAAHLQELPLPFIAHYDKEEHFVTVLAQPKEGKIRLYDTRVGHVHEIDEAYFKKQWSGHAILFDKIPTNADIRLASVESKRLMVGGCCGSPTPPDDMDDDECGCTSCGMPTWSVNPVNMNLSINDTPMWWDAPYGPSIQMTMAYNSQDSLISIRPFGDKWAFRYSAFAMQDPSGKVILMWGNAGAPLFTPNKVFTNGVPQGGFPVTFTPQARQAEFTMIQTSAFAFSVTDGGGTTYNFTVPTNMQGASAASLLTSIVDKYGTSVTITHNGQGAVITVSHSAGGSWNLIYGANGKVASMTDPFARTATFSYTNVNGQFRLTGQTDMGGVAYGYGYTTAASVKERDPLYPDFGHTQQYVTRSNELFINTLNLPTGTWQFYTEPADGIPITSDTYPVPGGKTWETYRITITDPLGQEEEYFWSGLSAGWHRDKKYFRRGVPTYGTKPWFTPSALPTATYYYYVYAGGRGEIAKTVQQGGGESSSSSFTDAGQPDEVIAPDGRITKYTYNSKGNVLTRQEGADNDPNRITYTTVYKANGMDVESQSKTIGNGIPVQESTATYDPVTRDVLTQTSYTIFNGQSVAMTTTMTYNAQGQVLETTSPRGAVTKNTYIATSPGLGRLEKVEYKGPGQTVFKVQAQYVYDNIGRVIAEQDSEGYLLQHEYDALNRRLKTTYPDTTYTHSTYSCCTLTSSRARDGSITQNSYDALKRLTQVVSPGGQTVAYEYDANDNVTKLRFGRGEWVAWEYDDGNRVTAKLYPDGKKLTYGYDRAKGGRLAWTKDASERQTTYNYYADGKIESVTHPELPTQSYTYDAEGRTLTWTDGTGASARETTYVYDVNGRMESLDGPLADDTLSYVYDQWGRMTSWSYAGGTESYTFDAFDRVTQITNPLGTFTQTYEGDTGILNEVQYPLPGMKTTYQRLPAAQDRLLTAIIHTKPTSQGGGELARYDYTYNAQRQIATWRQMQPGMAAKEWAIGYDARQQVSAIVETPVGGPPQTPQQVWRYQYDLSGNRTAVQEGSRTRTATYNDLNQLTSQTNGGTTWFRGKVNEPANVTIAGQNARVSADGSFESLTPVGPGTQDVIMQATDKAGNTTSQTWQVNNGPAGTATTTHDPEGNLLTDGTYTYTWDSKNRMTSVARVSQSSPPASDVWTFQYDGQNRRIAESKNDQPVRTWVWNGTSILEERTVAGGTKQRRWNGGLENLTASNQSTGKRLLITDHLGSTRVSVDGSGTTTASYAFTPWGKRSRIITGSEDLSSGYTGHLWHESGLSLAVYRPYDPETGRWPSRDPIQEKGGLNLFAASVNNLINRKDYLGLQCRILIEISHAGQFRYSPDSMPTCERYMAIGCYNTTDAINDAAVASGRGVPGFPRVDGDSLGNVSSGDFGRVGPDTSAGLSGGSADSDGQNGIYAAGADGFGQFLGHAQAAAYSAARALACHPCKCPAVTVRFFCNGPDIANIMSSTGYGHYCGMEYTYPASSLK